MATGRGQVFPPSPLSSAQRCERQPAPPAKVLSREQPKRPVLSSVRLARSRALGKRLQSMLDATQNAGGARGSEGGWGRILQAARPLLARTARSAGLHAARFIFSHSARPWDPQTLDVHFPARLTSVSGGFMSRDCPAFNIFCHHSLRPLKSMHERTFQQEMQCRPQSKDIRAPVCISQEGSSFSPIA